MAGTGQPPRRIGNAVSAVLRSWSELTPEEQKALLFVLGLFLLGAAVRFWRACAAGA